jgi:hypothetical protein
MTFQNNSNEQHNDDDNSKRYICIRHESVVSESVINAMSRATHVVIIETPSERQWRELSPTFPCCTFLYVSNNVSRNFAFFVVTTTNFPSLKTICFFTGPCCGEPFRRFEDVHWHVLKKYLDRLPSSKEIQRRHLQFFSYQDEQEFTDQQRAVIGHVMRKFLCFYLIRRIVSFLGFL